MLTASDLGNLSKSCSKLRSVVEPYLLRVIQGREWLECNVRSWSKIRKQHVRRLSALLKRAKTFVHFPRLTHLTFIHDVTLMFTGDVSIFDLYDLLPPNLTHLTFGKFFNRPLATGMLPANLTHLTFGMYFNQPLATGVLPANLTHLTFGAYFNQHLATGELPANLTHLHFGRNFNQPLQAGVLPSTLTDLQFDYQFNQPLALGVLPGNLTDLQFDCQFNQPLAAGVLPEMLKTLEFVGQDGRRTSALILPEVDGVCWIRSPLYVYTPNNARYRYVIADGTANS